MASSHHAGCFQLLEAPGWFQISSLRDVGRPIATPPIHMGGPRRSPGSRTKKTEWSLLESHPSRNPALWFQPFWFTTQPP